MNCPYCKQEMTERVSVYGVLCTAKTGEGKRMCGASVGSVSEKK